MIYAIIRSDMMCSMACSMVCSTVTMNALLSMNSFECIKAENHLIYNLILIIKMFYDLLSLLIVESKGFESWVSAKHDSHE